VRRLCKRKPRRVRMPTLLLFVHSPPTKVFLRCGKTPKRTTRNCDRSFASAPAWPESPTDPQSITRSAVLPATAQTSVHARWLLTKFSRLRIRERNLLNARVVVTTYNQHIGSFLPSLGLVGTTKSTQVQGADIVMKSLSRNISDRDRW
jgi:hypothetical protein